MAKLKKEVNMDDFEIIRTESISLNFYAVRNQESKWLNGRGSWVNDLAEARIYSNVGPAKARVTVWAKLYPELGVPDLVWIVAGTCHYLDQKKRVTASIKKKEEEILRKRIYTLNWQIGRCTIDTTRERIRAEELDNELKQTVQKLKDLQNQIIV